MEDRRTVDRRLLGDFVTTIFDDDAALCLGTDISENGVFVRSTRAVDATLADHGGPIVVQFELPTGERHWACGRTRRFGDGADGEGTAIEFTYVPERARSAIRGYVGAAAAP